MSQVKTDQWLEELKEVLRGEFRVETATTYSLSSGTTLHGLRIFRPQGTRWVKVEPLLFPPPGQGYPEVFELLAGLIREAQE